MNILIPICKGMRVGCDIMDASTQVIRFIGEPVPGEKPPSGYELVASIALAILGVTEAGALACSAPMKTMEGIKVTEVFIRFCNVPVRSITAATDCCDGYITKLQALERGVAPFFSIVRNFNELQIYQETRYLEMSPEERSHEHRSVLKPGSDPNHPEYEDLPITESDCKERLAAAQATYLPVLVGEIALRTGVVSTTGNRLTDLYQTMITRLSRRQGGVPAVGVPIPAVAVVAGPPVAGGGAPIVGGGFAVVGGPVVGVLPNYDPFDLLAQPAIPVELHADPVLARYTCAITLSPIRYPVGDPNGVTLYERSEIIRWIQQYGTSPITRRPLYVNQLVPRAATAALINNRLQFHSNRLRTLAAASTAHIAPDHALQVAANVENPRLD